jgi:hypothetical protein
MSSAIDLNKLNLEILDKYVVDVIREVNKDNFIKKSIEYLQTVASSTQDIPLINNNLRKRSNRNNNSYSKIDIIQDVTGPLDLHNATLTCSFLAGRKPKIYILPYILFAIGLKTKLNLIIEDALAMFKHKRTVEEQTKINALYKKVLGSFNVKVSFTSDIVSPIISSLLVDRLCSLNYEEFIQLLPYHHRGINYIKFFDIIHPLRQASVFRSLTQDYYLSAINTKTQISIVRKLANSKINVIYFPKLEIIDEGLKVYELGQDTNIFEVLNKSTINYLYKFYSFAFKEITDSKLSEKRNKLSNLTKSIKVKSK